MKNHVTFALGDLSRLLGTTLIGPSDVTVNHLAPVESAGPQSITFVAARKFVSALQQSSPTAVVLHPSLQDQTGIPRLLSDDPYRCYAKLTRLWAAQLQPDVDELIHPRAVVSPDADVAKSAVISANAVIEAGAVIADKVRIGAGAYVGAESVIGEGTTIHPNVTIMDQVKIGQHCEFHSGAIIGADGFGWAPAEQGWEKICQLGGVTIGNRVSVGACTTIDRGAIEDTVIEAGVILDNHIQIAHNVSIGSNTAIAGCTGIAGSTSIGRQCRIGGAVSIVGHISICDGVTITANSFVNRSIRNRGSYSSGYPVEESKIWRKNAVRLHRLDEMARQLFAKKNKHQ